MNPTVQPYRMRSFAVGALMALGGCASQRDDPTAAKAAVDKIWQEYSASLNAGDLNRWLALWTDDGIQMPPDEPPVVGKERIRARNAAVLDRFKFDIGIKNEEVQIVDGWGYSRGTYKATLTPKQGGQTIPIDGKYMTILARQSDGSWKIHRDIFNSNLAAAK
ncbi:MAG TPA: SgcJ/EcaC family oxidoreductase [Gemmatimonadales bacterium]|jgi:uncharacterized protein (TIGR02246 family)